MEISILLFRQILSMFIMILLGYILVKARLVKSEDSRVLSVLLLFVVMPCVILDSFQVDFSRETVNGLMLAFLAAVLVHILLLAAGVVLGKVFCLTEVEKASVIYSNAANLIIPIVTAVLGSEWVIYSCAFVSVQLLLIWTHGRSLMSGQRAADWRRILTNTNLLAVLAGFALFVCRLRLPGVLYQTVHSVGSVVAPVSMFITGMLIADMRPVEIFAKKRTFFIVALRMLFFPALMLVLLRFSPLSSLVENGRTVLLVTLLACSTPPASTVTQMAQVYGRDAKYASAVNVISTIVCIVTMPVIVYLYLL